jgi:ABC-2 type transport system permease protein
MNAFTALVRKDLILYLADRRALLMHLVLPIVIAAFFGAVFGGNGNSNGGAIDVALVQQDTSEAGARIAAGLRAESSLHVTPLGLAEAEAAVGTGKQAVAIVIPPGFSESAGVAMFGRREKPQIRLLYDPSQTAVLAMVKGMLTQQVMQVVSAEMFGGAMGRKLIDARLAIPGAPAADDAPAGAAPTRDMLERDVLVAARRLQDWPAGAQTGAAPTGAGGLSTPFTTQDERRGGAIALAGYNPYAHAFAGMGVQFILFMGVNMGIGMLLARREGIWDRLLAAPVSLATVVMARAASAAIIATCLLCAVFVVAVFGFHVHISSVPGFFGIALGFGALTAGFGLLIAAFGKTPEAARGIAMFATLILVMLGGAWVPTFVFPPWVQQVTMVVPTRWAISGLDAVTWRGLDAMAAAPAIAVQLAFAAAFIAAAIWKFKRT